MHINLEKKLPTGSDAARADRSPATDDTQPISQRLLTRGFADVAAGVNDGKVLLGELERELLIDMHASTGISSDEIVMMHGLSVSPHDIEHWIHSDGLTLVNPAQFESVLKAYEHEAGYTDSVPAARREFAHV